MNIAKFLRTGCQSTWCFSRNAVLSRMNIIFSGDGGNVIFTCIFSKHEHLCFFWPGGWRGAYNVAYAYRQKIPYFHAFFDKDHLLSFSAQRKNTIFSGKNKYHLSRYYKKDRVLARISWKDYLSRTPEENITFPGIFRGKIIFSFVSKL